MEKYNAKILMLVENVFSQDPRVKNEAFTLTEAGYKVSVIALREKHQKNRENFKGVKVYNVPKITLFKKSTSANTWAQIQLYRLSSAIGYVFEYLYFTTICFGMSLYVALKDGFDAIHVHNPPNTLFVIGVFYKLFGKKFIFDHHDLSPELFLSRYKIKDSIIYRALMLEEKLCLKYADIVIATNQSYKEIEIKRANLEPDKIFIVRNGPNSDKLRIVSPDEELNKSGKKILVYIGNMGPQDGVDYMLKALYMLVYKLGKKDVYCVIIGPGDSVTDLKLLAHELHLDEYVWFTGFIPKADLLRYLSAADICLDPNPSNPLNDYSTWIKVMEYMAYAKPIVSFDLKETRFSAREAAIYVTPNDEMEYARAIAFLLDHPEECIRMGKYGRQRVLNKLCWQHTSKNLLSAYRFLFPETAIDGLPEPSEPNKTKNTMNEKTVSKVE